MPRSVMFVMVLLATVWGGRALGAQCTFHVKHVQAEGGACAEGSTQTPDGSLCCCAGYTPNLTPSDGRGACVSSGNVCDGRVWVPQQGGTCPSGASATASGDCCCSGYTPSSDPKVGICAKVQAKPKAKSVDDGGLTTIIIINQ